MISHALTIVLNELNRHLLVYNPPDSHAEATLEAAILGNMSEGIAGGTGGGVPREKLVLSIVNIKEEKTLKNLPNYVRNEANLSVAYQNPPVYLNFQILITATHIKYTNALLMLSRCIRFFQFHNIFTQDNVEPNSIFDNQPNELDRLESFKLTFELYSPTMEEVNHLWGTLGGKQYPFVLYTLRMLDLKFMAVQRESGLITEVISDLYHKNAASN